MGLLHVCATCYKKKANRYKQPLLVIGRGQLKWYNPFVEEANYDYVAPSIAGLDKLGGHEPIYQRWEEEGREARGHGAKNEEVHVGSGRCCCQTTSRLAVGCDVCYQ
jgi:hypothetical protein